MKNYIKCKIKFLINCLISVVSIFIKRNKKIVLFGGWFGQRFADNSKSLYLFMHENKEKLGLEKVLFTTKNKTIYQELKKSGYDVVWTNSLLSLKYHLKAGYHIVDMGFRDLLELTSIGAKRLNLWHGFPIKKIGYYCINPKLSLHDAINLGKKVALGEWNDFYILVLSEKHKQFLQYAFGRSEEQMIVGIYPRIAYMLGCVKRFYLESELRAKNTIEKLLSQNKTILGYFPTFRDNSEMNKRCCDMPSQILGFLDQIDGYLITKMHFASSEQINKESGRIINIPPESDLYNFLECLDVLITDYSSVFFDFIFLGKPIIFYCFDLEYYENSDRGFLLDYDSVTLGDKVNSIKDLTFSLESVLKNKAAYLKKYEDIYKANLKLLGHDSTHYNSESLIQLCEAIL